MSKITTRSVPFVLVLMFTLSIVAVAPSASQGYDDGSTGTRTTEIDGEHVDEFDHPGSVSLYGNATVAEGALTLSRAQWEDQFDRVPLAPWTATEGTPYIVNQRLLTNTTMEGNATASRSMNLHDMEILLDLSPGLMVTEGPYISLVGPGMSTLYFKYSYLDREIQMGYVEAGMEMQLANSDAILETDEWYQVRIEIKDDVISFSIGPGACGATHSFVGNYTRLSLTSLPSESAAWDNVTVNRLHASGWAVTQPVLLPQNTYWEYIHIDTTIPTGTTMEISFLNASDDKPLPGLEDVSSTVFKLWDDRLETFIDPIRTPAIKLYVKMTTVDDTQPEVTMWDVSWLGDPPTFVKAIPQMEMNEDVPKQNAVDLRKHFNDRFTDPADLQYTISNSTNDMHVRPVVNGYNLSFELPTRNWYGAEQYKVTASDGVLSVESLLTKVVVKPVDDPPIVAPLPELEVKEDEVTILNITPYLADVDTPVRYLRVRALSGHITVEGQVLSILYDAYVPPESIELEVSDMTNTVQVFLDIVVVEVDDPPVLEEIEAVYMNEDEERKVDIADLISDEDTDLVDMTITIPDRDFNVTLDGTEITLLYTVGGGEYNYTVQVNDGNTTVSQMLEVFVTEVNDPPVITAVGDLELVDGVAELVMEEGNRTELTVSVEDEETSAFRFTLVSDLYGASLNYDVLTLVTELGGIGDYTVQISISDGGAAALVIINLEVANRNDPPQDVAVTSPEDGAIFTEGDEIPFNAYALDPDVAFGDVISFQWNSDRDGVLSSEKTFSTTSLSIGLHTITLEATDGEITNSTAINITIKRQDDNGNGGGGGDNGDGGGGGLSTGLMAGILVAVIVVIGVVLFVVKGRTSTPVVEVAAFDTERTKPKPGPKKVPTPKEGPTAAPTEAPPTPAEGPAPAPDEPLPATLPAEEPAPSPSYALDYEVAEGPSEREVGMTYEAVAVDTALLAESDPEQLRLDDLKRGYQAAISQLDFGVPAKELAGMDWYEVAGALATGEQRQLDDGRTVTQIGDHWFYSDTENLKTFLKRHDD